jgi:uncharacterized protein YutE (UPF0331/DUF86 family)
LLAAKEVFSLQFPRIHPESWAADILCEEWFLSTEKAQLISVLAAIWYSRNKLVHGTVGYDPGKCVEVIKQDLLEIVIPKVVVRKGAPKPVCKWTALVG